MKYKLIFSLLVVISAISCAGTMQDEEIEVAQCEKNSVADFDEFLNIPYGQSEVSLDSVLGHFTGGEYTADSTAFVYFFKRLQTAPITIWSNIKTGKVETIYVEILSMDEQFPKDVIALADEFNMKACEAVFFGMLADQIMEELGKPDKDVRNDEEGYRSIYYDSKDLKIALNFRCYDAQEKKCSAISVNWFY